MIRHTCDGCGREIPKGSLRYSVRIDVQAAYEQAEVGLLDLVRDHRKELRALIGRLKKADAQQVEESIHKGLELDLCPSCQRAFIRSPLRFHPEQGAEEPLVDIDSFLRSIGYGPGDASAKGNDAAP